MKTVRCAELKRGDYYLTKVGYLRQVVEPMRNGFSGTCRDPGSGKMEYTFALGERKLLSRAEADAALVGRGVKE